MIEYGSFVWWRLVFVCVLSMELLDFWKICVTLGYYIIRAFCFIVIHCVTGGRQYFSIYCCETSNLTHCSPFPSITLTRTIQCTSNTCAYESHTTQRRVTYSLLRINPVVRDIMSRASASPIWTSYAGLSFTGCRSLPVLHNERVVESLARVLPVR